MFDFGHANEQQKEAISTVDGPVLITAGPGTGKTYTLVQRAIYLIEECDVEPESIFIATFTEKAAKELVTRITDELAKRHITANLNEMYIGTFHSLCLRILKENNEYTRLNKNYRILDAFDQQYLVYRNMKAFENDALVKCALPDSGSKWKTAGVICKYVNNLSEELVEPEKLIEDKDPSIAGCGKMMEIYENLLVTDNSLDFSSIQVEAYHLLTEVPEVLSKLQEKLTFFMVDEYQDTNYIQEQIVFLLAGEKHNICVVGDDDQGLYRFRGATIRNILEFPEKFGADECKTISLVTNYRSNSDIVDFYNEWMQTTSGKGFKFEWKNYRFDKQIQPFEKTKLKSPGVIKLSVENDDDEWHESVKSFIDALMNSGKLTDYNQIAFLFKSVKNEKVKKLADYLEENHISVYSPRSAMFFERDEIRLVIGCLLLLFPRYVQELENGQQPIRPELMTYYLECIRYANSLLKQEKNKDWYNWMRTTGKLHFELVGTTDYAYSGLLYRMFEFGPFADIIKTDIGGGMVDVRPIRNLAKMTQILAKFEYLHHIDVLNGAYLNMNVNLLFNTYLRLLFEGGITEYEDDSEYAPSGCVSFLTIHQSKGMEFPVVIVGSLGNGPRSSIDPIMLAIEEKYYKRPSFEPFDQIKYFDFWRLYYTAFSRAQNLLVLTANETSRNPSKYFRGLYESLASSQSPAFDISEFEFATVKDVDLKSSFSFTSHVAVYETCPMQYKFYKELEFNPVRSGAYLFGKVVHTTIEDVHKAVLRNEEDRITKNNVALWFEANYISLSKTDHKYLAPGQKRAALEQVLGYVERQNGDWSRIKQAEVDVSLVQPDYIMEGKIDLIKGDGDTVELVDFKSEKKPDMEKDRERLERYRRQLHIYAYLVEQRTGEKVSKMHLYYTGEKDGLPTVTFPYTKTAIEGSIAAFDDTVQKIMKKDFSGCADNQKVCAECDFRFYCGN